MHISSFSITGYFEATDSLPFFTPAQQGLLNNRLGKIQFSLSYRASKLKHFTNSLFVREEFIPYYWQVTFLAAVHFMMPEETIPLSFP